MKRTKHAYRNLFTNTRHKLPSNLFLLLSLMPFASVFASGSPIAATQPYKIGFTSHSTSIQTPRNTFNTLNTFNKTQAKIHSVLSPAIYHHLFISYISPPDVTAITDYVKQHALGGLIVWDIKGDLPYTDTQSLLKTAHEHLSTEPNKTIMAYWENWSVYPKNRAIPDKTPYLINEHNTDLQHKLTGITTLAYAFLEAQAKTYRYYNTKKQQWITAPNPTYEQTGGTLYFYDPWADLLPPKDSPALCQNTQEPICWYVATMQGHSPQDSASMGNFIHFSQLDTVKRVISIGGYGHDDTFEEAFNTPEHLQNFVQSAITLVRTYHLDGIDLDYENPKMTHAQSTAYLTLIEALATQLNALTQQDHDAHPRLMVTLLADPAYLAGRREGQYGFAPTVLNHIGQHVDHINLMTYDFHGAFDYNPKQPNQSRTGFLTNVFLPDTADLPTGYQPYFSVDGSVNALEAQGVAPEKITVGLPTYGRALQHISEAQGGLYQSIMASEDAVPRGNIDDAQCATAIPQPETGACTGSFEYRYIKQQMLGHGLVETQQMTQDQTHNGTTGYATTWEIPTQAAYTLTMANTGHLSAGDLGMQIIIQKNDQVVFTSDWLNPGVNKSYDQHTQPSVTPLLGEHDLTAHWITYPGGPTGDCAAFNFDHDLLLSVQVSSQGVGHCYPVTRSKKL